MSESKTPEIPEPPSDTISGMETVHIDIEGLYRNTEADPGAPLDLKNLEIDSGDVLSTLTRKPPEKYKFRKSIGHGGMKVVIQVKDRDTTRDIAMALLPDAQSRPRRDIIRFIEEARITASLEHPNIVPVHDIGVDTHGSPYFTMKLIKGENLASVIRKLHDGDPEYLENYTLDKLLLVFIKICNGVAFAHSKGVLHLDLKPENIQLGDFGEVIIMDWGLAKVITEKEPDATAPPEMDFPVLENRTGDGIRKGTPGYMAPEQAAGKNSEKDFRTDVYSLGAILYSMLTFLNPLQGKTLKEMLAETINGIIVPPSKRAPDRIIPSSLEAVVMKAMAVKPADRYQGAKELRNDVLAFLSGHATHAERATPLKKALLFTRRHRISVLSVSVTLFLLLLTGLYAMLEFSRQHGDWISAFERDFTVPGTSLDGIAFYDGTLSRRIPAWTLSSAGLKMHRGEWLWLTDTKIKENVKIILEVFSASPGNAFEVCLNSRFEPLPAWWRLPGGYSFHTSGYRGSMDLIYKNEKGNVPEIISGAASRIENGAVNRIEIERVNEKLSVTVNGHELSAVDLFPLTGREYEQIGLRSFGSASVLCSIRVFRLALPEKASPVIAGDALVETRHFEDAIDKYLTIADDYVRGPVAEEALAKAYATAAGSVKDEQKRSQILIGIKRRIASRFTAFAYREKILEIDALMLWRSGNYRASLSIVNDIFKRNPNTGIVKNILQLPHRRLPDYVIPELMRNIVRTKDITRLNLSGYGIGDLTPLSGMKLVYLDCSDNNLTSLAGLDGMPLEVLGCSGNRITSLEPLRGLPLQTLFCQENLISDLSPLDSGSLVDLNCSWNRLSSLESLKGFALDRLLCRGNGIVSLEPLRGMPLQRLDAGLNPIVSLEPLRGMPLEFLRLDGTSISDLSPLRGMPLAVLGLYNCKKLRDISPLLELSTLEVLSISEDMEGIRRLKTMPGLILISSEQSLPFGGDAKLRDSWRTPDSAKPRLRKE